MKLAADKKENNFVPENEDTDDVPGLNRALRREMCVCVCKQIADIVHVYMYAYMYAYMYTNSVAVWYTVFIVYVDRLQYVPNSL